MRKLLLVSLLAMGMPFMPSASAEHHEFDCGFDTVAQETATGGQDTFTGVAYGYVVSPTPGEQVSIRCYVNVDSSEADSTPTGSGTNVATTAGQVTYTASDTQDVDLCAAVTTDTHGTQHTCFETTTTQIPPQEVIDAIDSIFTLFGELTAPLDPIACGALQAGGLPAIVNSAVLTTGIWIDPDDCDVWFVRNNPVFDCPVRIIDFIFPYGDPARSDMPACF